jgi:hypothetical protein
VQHPGQQPFGPESVSASASGVGGAVLPPTTVSFAANDGDVIFACTRITVTGSDGTTSTVIGDDQNGCKAATTAGPAEAQPWDRTAGAGPVRV